MQSRALIIHQDTSSQAVDVILHEVVKTPNGHQLLSGKVLDDRSLMELVAILSGTVSNSELLPPTVLMQRPNLLIWWKKPHASEVLCSHEGKYKRFPIHYPTLIFFAVPGYLHVAALKSSVRPNPQSQLFYAPIMNSDSDFGICTGNMTLPRFPSPESITQYESFFYDGAATHMGHSTIKGVQTTDQYVSYVRKHGKKPFGKAAMVESRYTLNRFIAKLLKGELND